nr:hypothetical protein [Tanacetum cinerariifolium]
MLERLMALFRCDRGAQEWLWVMIGVWAGKTVKVVMARVKFGRQSSTTQEYPSLIDTFFVAHTVNGEFLQDVDRRTYEEMRRLEATATYTDDEINRLARVGKQRGHILGVGRVLPARATVSPSTPAHESTLNSLHKKVVPARVAGAGTTRRVPTIRTTRMRMAMAILSCVIYGTIPDDMSSGNMCHHGTNYLTEKYVRPTVSLRIVAGEGIPVEHSPANILQRQVAGETFPQRQVNREIPEMSLGNVVNVVVKMAIEAAKKHKFPNGPPSRFPYLILPQKSKDKEFCELLLPFSNKNIHKKSICKIRLPQIYYTSFMTSCGWLVTVGEDHAPQLINPLSRETLNLPNVDTIPSLIYATLKETTVLVDVLMMSRNLFHEAKVRVAYLIGLDDGERKRLLVIIKEGKVLNKHIRTKRFLVSTYDLKNKKWSKVKDLGTKALFVGDASFWVEEDTTKGLKFRDDGYIAHGSWANGKARYMGIYHLSDETIEPYFGGGKLCHVTPPI